MKTLVCVTLGVALLAAAPAARAELFEVKAKLACEQPVGGFQLLKTKDSNLQLLAQALNVVADQAPLYALVYDPTDHALHVVQRCDGASSMTFATSGGVGSTYALIGPGEEKYVTRQIVDFQNWVGRGVHGAALCKFAGVASTLDDSPMTAKGSCRGNLRVTLVGSSFCQFQASIGKPLVDSGPCP